MISSWRRKRTSSRTGANITPPELIIPRNFRCPISLDMMKDPVTLSTGITYDRESIEKWIDAGNVTCPLTNQVLTTLDLVPNHTIRKMIQDWCVQNQARGVERIPTPRIPVSSHEVARILESLSKTRSPQECMELVGRIVRLLKESEKNKRCILGNGAATTLTFTFFLFADGADEIVIPLLEEVMVGLTLMMPLDYEAEDHLKSDRSLERLLWFIKRGSLSARINAVLLLKELISIPRGQAKVVETMVTSDGAMEGLVKLIKDPIRPSSTKAALVVIYHMIITSTTSYDSSTTASSHDQSMIVARFIDMGLASLVVDIIVDAEKSVCEKSLGVFDAICRCDVGREAAYNNALTVPVVVKKILRISDLATEFAVSILWRLCESRESSCGGSGVVVEAALQVGAFQKLLLVLQVGWNINERSREKVTKLLKLLNIRKSEVECIESTDFKDLKRSF